MAISRQTVVELLQQHRTTLIAYIWSIVRDQHLAAEVFDDVCLYALDGYDKQADDVDLADWVRLLARQRSFAMVGMVLPEESLVDDEFLDCLDAQWKRQQSHRRLTRKKAALDECVQKLSEYAQDVLTLRYGQGIDMEETADFMAKSPNAIYEALSRMHIALATCIKKKLTTGGKAS